MKFACISPGVNKFKNITPWWTSWSWGGHWEFDLRKLYQGNASRLINCIFFLLGRYRVRRIRQPPQIISKFQSYSFNNLASSQPYINMFQGKTCKRLVANWGQTTMHLLNSKMDRPTIYPIHCICPWTCNTSHIYTRQTRTHDKIQWSIYQHINCWRLCSNPYIRIMNEMQWDIANICKSYS